ncbi:MAG: FAD-dependent oxidoreductase [Paracoccaceae bacterium]
MDKTLHIVGGGMAGSEAAWQAARMGVNVVIHEMRPTVGTFAHRTGDLAEMVCSNSFRSDDDEQNAVGLLHWEMRAAGGLIMEMADAHRLPAGGALAVDRDPFARAVTERLRAHPWPTSRPARSPISGGRPVDLRHRPAHLGKAGPGHRPRNRLHRARLLRRHRPHRRFPPN